MSASEIKKGTAVSSTYCKGWSFGNENVVPPSCVVSLPVTCPGMTPEPSILELWYMLGTLKLLAAHDRRRLRFIRAHGQLLDELYENGDPNGTGLPIVAGLQKG